MFPPALRPSRHSHRIAAVAALLLGASRSPRPPRPRGPRRTVAGDGLQHPGRRGHRSRLRSGTTGTCHRVRAPGPRRSRRGRRRLGGPERLHRRGGLAGPPAAHACVLRADLRPAAGPRGRARPASSASRCSRGSRSSTPEPRHHPAVHPGARPGSGARTGLPRRSWSRARPAPVGLRHPPGLPRRPGCTRGPGRGHGLDHGSAGTAGSCSSATSTPSRTTPSWPRCGPG